MQIEKITTRDDRNEDENTVPVPVAMIEECEGFWGFVKVIVGAGVLLISDFFSFRASWDNNFERWDTMTT